MSRLGANLGHLFTERSLIERFGAASVSEPLKSSSENGTGFIENNGLALCEN